MLNRTETLSFLRHLSPRKPRLLRGPAGIGKDALVEDFAKEIGFNVVELALTELEPTDVVGMPYIEEGKTSSYGGHTKPKTTKYARPFWWPEDGKTILFLNELDLANEQMFPIAMRLACKRMAGALTLPNDTIIFAAGNGSKYQRQPLDQALLRRFAVIDYCPTVEEWLTWAKATGLNGAVIEFIEENPASLDTPPQLIGQRNLVVPTRASWADLGDYLNRSTKEGKLSIGTNRLAQMATAFVGSQAAVEFQSWVAARIRGLKVEDVWAGTLKPEQANLLQASHIIGAISKEFMSRAPSQQMNALSFYVGIGKEAFAALFAALPREAASVIKEHGPAHQMLMGIVRR